MRSAIDIPTLAENDLLPPPKIACACMDTWPGDLSGSKRPTPVGERHGMRQNAKEIGVLQSNKKIALNGDIVMNMSSRVGSRFQDIHRHIELRALRPAPFFSLPSFFLFVFLRQSEKPSAS
jgi:hypothetical protein